MSQTSLRLRVVPRYPAKVTATDGLKAVRDGVDLVVKSDYSSLVQVPTVANPDKTFMLAWDSDIDNYQSMSFTNIINNIQDAVIGPPLAAIDAANPGPNQVIYFTETGVAATYTTSDFVRSISNASDANALSTALGLIKVPSFASLALTPQILGAKSAQTEFFAPNYADPNTLVGGATFIHVDSNPGHSLCQPCPTGGYWTIAIGSEIQLEQAGGIPYPDNSYGTINSDAMDRIINFWKNGPKFQLSVRAAAGEYRFARSHGFIASAFHSISLNGVGSNLTYFAPTFGGTDASLKFLYTDDTRNNRFSMQGINLVSRNPVGTVCPVLLSTPKWLESNLYDVRFTQASFGQIGNTLWETSGIWNCNVSDCHSFGGGHYKPGNALSNTVTFALNGTTAIVASEAVFSASDVGKKFLFGSAGGRWIGTVQTFTDSTHVVMTEAAVYSGATEVGWCESVKASTTAASNIVNLNAAGAVASDKGRWIVIRGAGTVSGSQTAHRAKITDVNSPTQIVIDTPAPRGTSNATCYFSPAIMIYYDSSDAFNNSLNDVTFSNNRFEIFSGLGMFIEEGVQVKLIEPKFHGADYSSVGYSPTRMTQAHFLGKINAGHSIGGAYESYMFDDAHIIMTGSAMFKATDGEGLCLNGQSILLSEFPKYATAAFELGSWTLFNDQSDVDQVTGSRSVGYIRGDGSTQFLSQTGIVKAAFSGKIFLAGGPTQVLKGASARGTSKFFLNIGSSVSPNLVGAIDGSPGQFTGILHVWSDIDAAGFHFFTNGAGFYRAKLVYGDTSIWAASATPNASTASKVTFSIDNTKFYLNNQTTNNIRLNWFFTA